VAPGDRGFLAAVLKPGMRAVSVSVTATSGISGFVFPGDRVDLLLTHVVPQAPQQGGGPAAVFDRRAAVTMMRGIRVLAIDQKTESKAGEAAVAHTATLEVTAKESEIIALAAEMGKLSLSLHRLADDQLAAAPGDDTGSSPGKRRESFTLDNEASQLLPPMMLAGGGAKVSVLRAGKSEDLFVTRSK
jgi:pilus assembly protein CpaB